MIVYKIILRHFLLVLITGLGLVVAGCGNSGGGGTASTITGTAATGAPMAGYVYIVDANGTEINVPINGIGTFSADVSGMTAPFALRAIPNGGGETQYSYAASGNISVNITPLTTLAFWTAYPGNLAGFTAADAWPTNSSAVTQEALAAAIATVNANFASQLAANGLNTAFNFFIEEFAADGTGFDAVLDALSITLDMVNSTLAIEVGGVAFAFDSGIDISGITIGWGGSTGGTELPEGVAGQAVTMEYCCAAGGSPYTNGDQVLFTFSSSGALMLTEQYTVVAESFTVDEFGQYIWSATDGTQYVLSLIAGAIHEVNVMDASNNFLGQFAPVGGGAADGGDWNMILSGSYTQDMGGYPYTVNIGPMTLSGPFAAPTVSDVESAFVTQSYNPTGAVTVTTLLDTETQRKFRVQFTALVGDVESIYDLTYDYNLIQ